MKAGVVYLVGAGPGDPGLITVRGREILSRADVVLYDRLVSSQLLTCVKTGAELIDVGKSPNACKVSQDEIQRLMVAKARQGSTVVRLKGGDPFVFGRGFEELQACRAAGIACVVVPGVSSAIAAPAAAGIPVTVRGTSDSFAVITAAGRDGGIPNHDFAALAALDTLVVLMGHSALAELCDRFIAVGRSPDTPMACIERATTPFQRQVSGTLDSIVNAVETAGLRSPMVMVLGEVARFAELKNSLLPLSGKRILNTRPPTSGKELDAALTERGAAVIRCPLTRIQYCTLRRPDVEILEQPFDWVIFTSQHGVHGYFKSLSANGFDVRVLANARIAAIGPATAKALRRYGLKADLLPNVPGADGLTKAFQATKCAKIGKVLFPCGNLAGATIGRELSRLGGTVSSVIVYETSPIAPLPATRAAIAEGLHAVLFFSPSAVRSFAASGLTAQNALIACIGETTATTAREHGLPVDIIPLEQSQHSLIQMLTQRLSSPVGVSS